jgi:hypothetical protein
VHPNHHSLGRLLSISASLLLALASEIMKWQFPLNAAAEKLATVVDALRSAFPTPMPQKARR